MKHYLFFILGLAAACQPSQKQQTDNNQLETMVYHEIAITQDADAAGDKACDCVELLKIDEKKVWKVADEQVIFYKSGMAIDADGSPRAYHPQENKGLDDTRHAGTNGNWWALATDTGTKDGTPVIQTAQDPAPGFYVSMTSLQDFSYSVQDPKRYVDAEQIPYFVLPPQIKKEGNVPLAAYAAVYNLKNEELSFAIFADVGPNDKLGEGSIKLAQELQIPSSPRIGGVADGVLYLILTQTGDGTPQTRETIRKEAKTAFENWGGLERLKKCLKSL